MTCVPCTHRQAHDARVVRRGEHDMGNGARKKVSSKCCHGRRGGRERFSHHQERGRSAPHATASTVGLELLANRQGSVTEDSRDDALACGRS